MPGESDHLLDIPDKCAQTELGSFVVELTQTRQHCFHTTVFNNREDCRGHGRPGVRAVVRLAVDTSAPCNLSPCRETAAVGPFEHLDDALVVCLIKGYEYGFHTDAYLVDLAARSALRCFRRWFLIPRDAKTQ